MERPYAAEIWMDANGGQYALALSGKNSMLNSKRNAIFMM